MIQVVAVSALVSWLVATVTAKLCFHKIDRYIKDTTDLLQESADYLTDFARNANSTKGLSHRR